ncbi:hypothetical protein HYZ97_03120 [Candidatus Pacearchaeota archaeon]|nr:hypothetical protein [Candidatus Pacearchaeota archaeon]
MSLICCETEEPINNPFYIANAFVYNALEGKEAVAVLDIAVSRHKLKKMPLRHFSQLWDKSRNPLIYSLQEARGRENQFGIVQVCWGWEKEGSVYYLTPQQALQYLPRTAREFVEVSPWVEKIDRKWQKVPWASALAKKLFHTRRREERSR